jgi:hypothetical protein
MHGHGAWASTVDDQPTHAPGLAAIFKRAGLRHALIGGHGVNTWIMPRETDDYDFIVEPKRAAIEQVEAELVSLGLKHVRRQDNQEDSGPDFSQMKDTGINFAVDFQVAKTDYQMLVLDRAKPSEASGFNVATPEDLVVLKLLAMRSQDQRDIALLVDLLGDTLDWAYIEHWAAVWDVTDKLRVFRPAPG